MLFFEMTVVEWRAPYNAVIGITPHTNVRRVAYPRSVRGSGRRYTFFTTECVAEI